MTEFVVNLHVTERCNYGCTFCFGKWGLGPGAPEIFEDAAGEVVVEELFGYFGAGGARVRFNFVGGEPAMLRRLPRLIEVCRALGARVSYVSNGLMLRRFEVPWTAENVDIVGISIDSLDSEVNRRVGRTGAGPGLEPAFLNDYLARLRKQAATYLKLNTVVCRANHEENLSPLLEVMNPDRWKVFRMLPVYDRSEAVTAGQFRAFLRRHRRFGDILISEDNDEMTGSYVMVDPMGRFFWHLGGQEGYRYSRPIPEVGVETAFASSVISWEKFGRRYRSRIAAAG